jgi:hypothetical protein
VRGELRPEARQLSRGADRTRVEQAFCTSVIEKSWRGALVCVRVGRREDRHAGMRREAETRARFKTLDLPLKHTNALFCILS